jgi:N-acetylornithine carbamoyltransferase
VLDSPVKNWIDADLELDGPAYRELVERALRLKDVPDDAKRSLLDGRAVYFLFFNQSLRTRSSFQTGLQKLGGHAIELEPGTAIYTPALPGREIPYVTERVADVANVLSEFGDAIAVRIYGEPAGWVYGGANQVVSEFGRHARVPVINMECDKFHPCQALADVMTIRERLGDPRGRRLTISWAYSGSWHKPVAVPQSLLLASAKLGMDITVAHPPGFDLDPTVLAAAESFAGESGASVRVTNDFQDGARGADVLYAKSWCSLESLPKQHGDPVDEQAMTSAFEANQDWRVDDLIMASAAPGAGYMHCLPADRDQEVTSSVIDGDQSWIYSQAGNRLHAQNAIMTQLLNPGGFR